MMMFVIAELSILGYRHHDKRCAKFKTTDKKYAYHVYMCALYCKIMELTLESDKLHHRYLQKGDK